MAFMLPSRGNQEASLGAVYRAEYLLALKVLWLLSQAGAGMNKQMQGMSTEQSQRVTNLSLSISSQKDRDRPSGHRQRDFLRGLGKALRRFSSHVLVVAFLLGPLALHI